MPKRSDDQKVDAFSAPLDLLARAQQRAVELGMTKSGFYRYCLAKELGYSEDEARDLAQHGAIRNLAESTSTGVTDPFRAHRPNSHLLNDAPNSKAAAAASRLLRKAARAPKAK